MGKLCKDQLDFAKLFDSQIATLKDRGCPGQILELLQNQKDEVLKRASEIPIGEGNIPFLPVIKPACLGYYGLMTMVRNGVKAGYTFLNPTAITDVVSTPDGLYYVYDVEDGNSTRGKSPENAKKILKQQKRSPLTAAEVTALATHTDVLSKHDVWATGSRYGSSGGVPVVWLLGGGPELGCGRASGSNTGWGSPSCGSR